MENKIELHLGDCLEILPTLAADSVDAVITDPPYPDYHKELYQYYDGILDPLKLFVCIQLIFWSAKVNFPLDYSSIHIWDKVVGVGSMYERIFERNGKKIYKVFRAHPITCEYIAIRSNDVYTGHQSQKPVYLLRSLIEKFTDPRDTILDPFMGSGTTGVACIETGRNFIGIEIHKSYFEMAEKRIAEAQLQMRFDL